jgi:hypothetical protein
MKGAQIWTLKKGNNLEWRVLFSNNKHFSVKNDMQEHGNILILELVQHDTFQTVNSCLKMAKYG